jgi:hypothetical protein
MPNGARHKNIKKCFVIFCKLSKSRRKASLF